MKLSPLTERTEDGRQLRILVVIDEFTRECLGPEGDAWCFFGRGCAPPSAIPRRLLFPNSLMSTGTRPGGAT